jgi:hypothetical protein
MAKSRVSFDGRLRAQGAPLLQVLLELGAAVADLERGFNAVAHDARLEAAGSRAGAGADDAPLEDDRDAIMPAERELLAQGLLEPEPGGGRRVEDAGVRELELAHGELVPVARGAVCGQ